MSLRDVEDKDRLLGDDAWAKERSPLSGRWWSDPILWLTGFSALVGFASIGFTYGFKTTVPGFVGAAVAITCWTILTWARIIVNSLQDRGVRGMRMSERCRGQNIRLILATALVSWWVLITITESLWEEGEVMPKLQRGDKYFIAANLHNNEDIMERYNKELLLLINHLGRENVYVSVYESNSIDATSAAVAQLDRSLAHAKVQRRVISHMDEVMPSWDWIKSSTRIEFLSYNRNKAMEPLQSPDDTIRLPNWERYTKVIFLNDVLYRWQDIIKLIATTVDGQEYDLACGLDFNDAGFYDTWVARDICGNPFIRFWPYVHDPASRDALRQNRPFPVSACWNGAVVFKSDPVLYRAQNHSALSVPVAAHRGSHGLRKRTWKAVDDPLQAESVLSPALTSPIEFRASGLADCDHSECFLFSYDLHRLYKDTPDRPRILLNPTVKMTYSKMRYEWHHVFLERAIIKWWLKVWVEGIGHYLLDGLHQLTDGRTDTCTWSGLKIPLEHGRCPPLPRHA